MGGEGLFGWIAIGAAASLAGMIWPFRRGVIGVVVNLLAGIIGAVLCAVLSFLVVPWDGHGERPARLFFAAVGALASLGLVHVGWTWAWASPAEPKKPGVAIAKSQRR
jgi:uncharacterized membrane protein YeaQ/YmgE (transglycosylase-associated protein family)